MKIPFLIILIILSSATFSQTKLLSTTETNQILSESVKKTNGINFPVYKTFEFKDKSGTYYTALTESKDSVSGKDTLNSKIKGITLLKSKSGLTKKWELNDFKNKEENSIWFWTKYCSFTDLDKDSLTDAVIVYGTSGSNGTMDGRVKILIYYKDKKYAIRHQNGVLDFERKMTVDAEFYKLPETIQIFVKAQMKKMAEDNNTIFPANWEEAMKKKQSTIAPK